MLYAESLMPYSYKKKKKNNNNREINANHVNNVFDP
jgi:hypothetical protein